VKLLAPRGYPSNLIAADGTAYTLNIDGTIDVAAGSADPFIAQGFTPVADLPLDSPSGRPASGLVPGLLWFDLTLGIPIWRNAGNTAWISAAGATV
jgi:hypothetical protein